jgi:UDP-3-O-[3-hydroxymyristoyl] glucosamine N-acyltransferase
MTHSVSYTLLQLAEIAKCEVVGDPTIQISALASLTEARAHQLSYLSDTKMQSHLISTNAAAVILKRKHLDDSPCAALVSDNPQLAFAKIAALFVYKPQQLQAVHPSAIVPATAVVDKSARIGAQAVIGERCVIGPGVIIEAACVVGDDVSIAADSHLYPHVTIYHGVTLGARVTLHAGAVIGSDGFGNVLDEHHHWVAVPQLGSVRIGDDVSIGANTTIDRGALGDTVIEQGVRLDNQIQIAHNVHIGAHTAVAGCVGIAGSATIGAHCMIGGGSCIGGHLTIVDGVILTGMSMVTRSITERGAYSSGTGLQSNNEWHKSVVRFRQLDAMSKRIKHLEKSETKK